jgi:hypothetical protein
MADDTLPAHLLKRTGSPMAYHTMTLVEFVQMRRDFDAMISTVEQEYPPEDDRHKLATAMRKRWFP